MHQAVAGLVRHPGFVHLHRRRVDERSGWFVGDEGQRPGAVLLEPRLAGFGVGRGGGDRERTGEQHQHRRADQQQDDLDHRGHEDSEHAERHDDHRQLGHLVVPAALDDETPERRAERLAVRCVLHDLDGEPIGPRGQHLDRGRAHPGDHHQHHRCLEQLPDRFAALLPDRPDAGDHDREGEYAGGDRHRIAVQELDRTGGGPFPLAGLGGDLRSVDLDPEGGHTADPGLGGLADLGDDVGEDVGRDRLEALTDPASEVKSVAHQTPLQATKPDRSRCCAYGEPRALPGGGGTRRQSPACQTSVKVAVM